MNPTSSVHPRSHRCHALLSDVTKRTIALVCLATIVIGRAVVVGPTIGDVQTPPAPAELLAGLERPDGTSVRMFEDGRLEVVSARGEKPKLGVAEVEDVAAIRALSRVLPGGTTPPAESTGATLLRWTKDHVAQAAQSDAGGFRQPFLPVYARLDGLALKRMHVDSQQSFIKVKTSSSGLLSAFGHDHEIMVGKLSGVCRVDPANLPRSSVDLVVNAGSLAVVDDASAKDRTEIEKEMNASVLDVARFPEIVFRSVAIGAEPTSRDARKDGSWKLSIEGDLTLHGVTRRVRLPARLVLADEHLRVEGRIELKQSDYGIERTSAVAGTVKVADEVAIAFDVFASGVVDAVRPAPK